MLRYQNQVKQVLLLNMHGRPLSFELQSEYRLQSTVGREVVVHNEDGEGVGGKKRLHLTPDVTNRQHVRHLRDRLRGTYVVYRLSLAFNMPGRLLLVVVGGL